MSPATVINNATEQAQRVAEAFEKSAKAGQQAATETAKEATSRLAGAVTSWIDMNRKITLAGLGAAALINDEFSTISARCLERGEQVEKEVKAYTETQVEAFKKLLPKFPTKLVAAKDIAAEAGACEDKADEATEVTETVNADHCEACTDAAA